MSLITKLDSNVTDTSLLQLGALRLKSKVVEIPSGNKRVFGISGPFSAKVIGDPLTCYFTDVTLSQNNGQEITFTGNSIHYAWVSNAECEIVVKPKYGVINFVMNSEGVYFDSDTFDDIGIIPGCTSIQMNSESSAGDVAKLKGLEALTNLSVNVSGGNFYGIYGDLDVLKDLPLVAIYLPRTYVHANIGVLAEMDTLKSLNLFACELVEGSVDAFADRNDFTYFNIGALINGINTKITGSITSLGKMINATRLEVAYSAVTGSCDDLAAALAANGKTSGTVQIRSGDGTTKSYTFPLA